MNCLGISYKKTYQGVEARPPVPQIIPILSDVKGALSESGNLWNPAAARTPRCFRELPDSSNTAPNQMQIDAVPFILFSILYSLIMISVSSDLVWLLFFRTLNFPPESFFSPFLRRAPTNNDTSGRTLWFHWHHLKCHLSLKVFLSPAVELHFTRRGVCHIRKTLIFLVKSMAHVLFCFQNEPKEI